MLYPRWWRRCWSPAPSTLLQISPAPWARALRLVVGGSAIVFAAVFRIALPDRGSPHSVSPLRRHFKVHDLEFVLFYVAAAFSVSVPWSEVARATFLPSIKLDYDTILMVVAIFGTTISPYLFFWQASQEAEESDSAIARSWPVTAHRRRIRSGRSRSIPGRNVRLPIWSPFSSS